MVSVVEDNEVELINEGGMAKKELADKIKE